MRLRTRERARPGAIQLAYSGAASTLRIQQNTNGAELRFRALLSEERTLQLDLIPTLRNDGAHHISLAFPGSDSSASCSHPQLHKLLTRSGSARSASR